MIDTGKKEKKFLFLDIDKTITSKDFFHGVKYKGRDFYQVLVNDEVPPRMKNIVARFSDSGFDIFIFTGRDLDYKKCTGKFWKNNFPEIKCKIFYCGENSGTFNYDNYVVLKVERMIRYIIKKKCRSVVVVDDDERIIDMMRKNVLFTDLKCFKIPDDVEKCERFIEVA